MSRRNPPAPPSDRRGAARAARPAAPPDGGGEAADIRDFVVGTADTAGQLRAKRGRVYTLEYVARDAAGNERTCTTKVTAPRDCRGARAARAAKEVRNPRRR